MSFSRYLLSKRHLATLLIPIGAAAVLLCQSQPAVGKAKPKTLIKFATLAPEGSTWMKVMHALDDEVRAKTDGRVGFKFYPGGVQGDEKEVLRKIRNGQLHGGGFTGFGLGAIASEFRTIELPFMFKDLHEVDYVRGKMNPYYHDLFREKGYDFLGWGDVGFVYLYSKNPITDIDQLRHAKMWTWSGDLLAQMFFKAFQISPIPLALPDVLTSLQMGVIDAVYSSPLACVALQWFTRVKYMTDVPITYGFGAMLVTTKILEKVEPADLTVLREAADKYSKELIDKTRAQNKEAITAMQNEGIEVLKVEPKVEDEFFTTGRAAWKDGIGELYTKELLDRVISLVEEYRQSHPDDNANP